MFRISFSRGAGKIVRGHRGNVLCSEVDEKYDVLSE